MNQDLRAAVERCAVCGHRRFNHAYFDESPRQCGVPRCRCRQWFPPHVIDLGENENGALPWDVDRNEGHSR